MTDSLAEWLRLREAADREARSSRLVQQVADAVAADGPWQVLDLGTGTGSNVRYVSERLAGRQRWLVVDRSPDLLALVSALNQSRDCEIETLQRDLRVLDDPGLFARRHLVTASALLDLVSESWLRSLAAHCRAVGAAALFALTYNGQSSCFPEEPEDELIRELLNQHQHTDKGLGGVAAGPDAVACAERCFTEVGYEVRTEPTDWNLGPAHADMQRYLINDWARAAGELAPDRLPLFNNWRDRRLAHIDAGRSRIIVRHHDLAAWPAKP
jgi:trans-aconitate methyltransferase